MGLPLNKNNTTPSVCVIITAWNQIEKTLACLKTVYAQTYPSLAVLLVDNGSEPDFQKAMRAQFPQVNLLVNEHNLGFAGGYNSGIQAALAHDYEYLFLLNNDTLLAEDCLAALVEGLEARPQVALATAKIYYAAEPQRIWTVGANFRPWLLELRDDHKGELDVGQWAEPRPIEMAPFCGVLTRRELFERVGYLDDSFFLYYEDLDYCQRMKQAGERLMMLPAAHLWHVVSASSGGAESPQTRYWLARSSGRYFRKHGQGWRLWLIVPFRLASALRLTIRLYGRREWETLRRYWQGLKEGWLSRTDHFLP